MCHLKCGFIANKKLILHSVNISTLNEVHTIMAFLIKVWILILIIDCTFYWFNDFHHYKNKSVLLFKWFQHHLYFISKSPQYTIQVYISWNANLVIMNEVLHNCVFFLASHKLLSARCTLWSKAIFEEEWGLFGLVTEIVQFVIVINAWLSAAQGQQKQSDPSKKVLHAKRSSKLYEGQHCTLIKRFGNALCEVISTFLVTAALRIIFSCSMLQLQLCSQLTLSAGPASQSLYGSSMWQNLCLVYTPETPLPLQQRWPQHFLSRYVTAGIR